MTVTYHTHEVAIIAVILLILRIDTTQNNSHHLSFVDSLLYCSQLRGMNEYDFPKRSEVKRNDFFKTSIRCEVERKEVFGKKKMERFRYFFSTSSLHKNRTCTLIEPISNKTTNSRSDLSIPDCINSRFCQMLVQLMCMVQFLCRLDLAADDGRARQQQPGSSR